MMSKIGQHQIQHRKNSVQGQQCELHGARGQRQKVADKSKVKAIAETPPSTDKEGIQRMLGMTKYRAQYIPSEAYITAQLRQLL